MNQRVTYEIRTARGALIESVDLYDRAVQVAQAQELRGLPGVTVVKVTTTTREETMHMARISSPGPASAAVAPPS